MIKLITLACRPSVLNPSFSVFCFLRRREIEFALAHRRLRVQRLSQNAIDSPGFRNLDTIVTKLVFMYVIAGSCHAYGTFFVY
jgi:hypothetical protein